MKKISQLLLIPVTLLIINSCDVNRNRNNEWPESVDDGYENGYNNNDNTTKQYIQNDDDRDQYNRTNDDDRYNQNNNNYNNSNRTGDTTSYNSTNIPDNKQFVQDAASDGMFEIKAGQLAKEKSSNQKINELAQLIITDHQKANEKLKEVAQKNNWQIPNEMMQKHQNKYGKLHNYAANDFNKEYTQMMIHGHNEVIDRFENMANKTDNQDLKNWINNTIPTLRQHLNKALEVQNNLNS